MKKQARQCECGAVFIGVAGEVHGTARVGNLVCAIADPDHPCRACARLRSIAAAALAAFVPGWQRARAA